MSAWGWCLVSAALLAVAGLLWRAAPGRARLPGDFDFDAYKTREIVQRGVFDKTKWR